MKRGKRILAMVLAILLVMPMTTAMGAEANTGKLTQKTISAEKSNEKKTEMKTAQKSDERKADGKGSERTAAENVAESDAGQDPGEKESVSAVETIVPEAELITTPAAVETPKGNIASVFEKKAKAIPKATDTPKPEDKNKNEEINPASLLPLEEHEAYLILNEYTKNQLEKFSVKKMLELLEDSDGNPIEIDKNATTMWRYSRDGDSSVEEYEMFKIADGETINLYAGDDIDVSQFEIIVGQNGQLNTKNKRYIVRAVLRDDFDEKMELEVYVQDNQSARRRVKENNCNYWISQYSDGTEELNYDFSFYLPNGESLKDQGSVWLNIKSELAKNPRVEIRIYPVKIYEIDGKYVYVTEKGNLLNNQILNQNMDAAGAGYQISGERNTDVTFQVEMYIDGKKEPYSKRYLCMRYWNWYPAHVGELYTLQDNGVQESVYSDLGTSFDYKTHVSTLTYKLKSGFPANDKYYFNYDFIMQKNYGNADRENYDVYVKKVVLGHYDSVEEAEAAGAEDVTKDILRGNGFLGDFSGKGMDFTIFKHSRLSLTFPIAYDTLADKITVKAEAADERWEQFSDAPIIGEPDPWFRVIGASDQNGNALNNYIVENGKSINMDTMYGYGYQTILLDSKGSDPESMKIYPRFDFENSENAKVKVTNIYIGNGEPFEVDENKVAIKPISLDSQETTVNFSVRIEDESGPHTKNYVVSFVKKADGPKLYVVNPKGGKETDPVRSVFLDDYFEEKHDIFIANVGSEKLTGLQVKLDATHVKLDDYWTVGGEGNDSLAPFETTRVSDSGYGELANIAKIRLLPDGEGEIEGTLTVSANGQDPVVIKLSGRAQNPRITTDKLGNAVKYVPYSYIIATNNMYDWNSVKFSLVSGSLPEGMTLIQDTGEIYGAPLKAGTYNFTVRADYGREDYFEPSEKKLTITVLENENETVFKTSDDGYAIVPEENGVNGYIGEKVSDYEFVLSSVDEDEVYISGGEYGKFAKLWLNGEELTKGTDYVTDEGSTRITIRSQTLRDKAKEGNNTISAEFNENEKRGESLKRTSQNFRLESLGENNPGENNPGEDTPSNPTVNITTHVVNGSGSSLANYTVELHSTVITRRTNSSGNATFNGVEMGKHTFYVKNTSGTIVATKGFTLIAGDELSFDGDRITARPGQSIEMTITANGSNTSISNVSGTKSTGGSAGSTVNSTVNNTTATKESSSKQADSAKTGDETPVWLWLMLSLLTGIAALGLILMKKRVKR